MHPDEACVVVVWIGIGVVFGVGGGAALVVVVGGGGGGGEVVVTAAGVVVGVAVVAAGRADRWGLECGFE